MPEIDPVQTEYRHKVNIVNIQYEYSKHKTLEYNMIYSKDIEFTEGISNLAGRSVGPVTERFLE